MSREAICQLLSEKINTLINKEDKLSRLLPDITLLYDTQPWPRMPVMYQPGVIFLFSGHSRFATRSGTVGESGW